MANLGQLSQVSPVAITGGLVKLEVPGVDDRPFIGVQDDPQRVGQGVGRRKEADRHILKVNFRGGVDFMKVIEFLDLLVLLHGQLGQFNRQTAPKDRHLEVHQKVRQGPNRVGVTVG